MDTADLLSKATKHRLAGNVKAAESAYRKILRRNKWHAESLSLLGLICLESSRFNEAETLTRQAIAVDNKQSEYYSNLGNILLAKGRMQEAHDCYQRALSINPNSPEILNNAALVTRQRGQLHEALLLYERALAIRADIPELQTNTGDVRRLLGDMEGAERCFEKALSLKPDMFDAAHKLGLVYQIQGKIEPALSMFRRALIGNPGSEIIENSLGAAYQANGDLTLALKHYLNALRIAPSYPEAQFNLGTVLERQGDLQKAAALYRNALLLKPELVQPRIALGNALRVSGSLNEAIVEFEKVLNIDPRNAEANSDLGIALNLSGKFEEAVQKFELAIKLKPSYVGAHVNLGDAFRSIGRFDKAADCFNQALRLDANSALAHLNLSLLELQCGDYESGWRRYEYRWKTGLLHLPACIEGKSLWDGRALDGARILLIGEQGFGDSLQFLRYVPMVQEAGGAIVLQLPPGLHRIASTFTNLSLGNVGDDVPKCDWYCPLMSLPMVFGTTVGSIPARNPYLIVPQDSMKRALEIKWPSGGLRVGLVWSGNPKNTKDHRRSISFDLFGPLLDCDFAHFYSLQVGVEFSRSESKNTVEDLGNLSADFADTAAFISNLDLVISVDTSVAHLAGALAKPVWILLSKDSDHRWLTNRDDSPWYPSAKLFRQSKLDEWSDVMTRVKAELIKISKSAYKLEGGRVK